MTTSSIDHMTLAGLIEACAVQGTRVVGQAGGWGVIVQCGVSERRLTATRSKEVRVFKRFETLVGYLKRMGIKRFEVDVGDFDNAIVKAPSRPDTSAHLRQAHAALAHDQWFREEVAKAIEQADEPTTQWVTNEEVMAESAKRRAQWRERAAIAPEKDKL
jgi:hypothetical protein